MNHRYAVSAGWKVILADVGLNPTSVLRHAGLPDDLLNSEHPRVSAAEFMRFASGLEAVAPDNRIWIALADAMSPEFFSAPLFAALCSPNLAVASERLARFKPLIAPVDLDVARSSETLSLTYRWKPSVVTPPASLDALEALFITKLARLGTRAEIRPVRVSLRYLPRDADAFEDFLGVRMTAGGDAITVEFTRRDAERPFVTSNDGMWSIFEPELRKRLADLDGAATFEARTRAVLLEALPSGQSSMDAVARRLGVSGRTLQRRLGEEGTHFKELVRSSREGLARHYLRQTQLTATEIAFLLGFEEPTSFFRAFMRWTGSTPEAFRRSDAATPSPT